jgi:hypothetical protein
MVSWILSLMLFLAPHSQYRESFDKTATAIDEVAHEHPIYDGNDGPERTVVELVAVSFWESSFNPRAIGHDSFGRSLGLAQIHESNLKQNDTDEEGIFDVKKNLTVAAIMMRESHRICRKTEWIFQLAEYATGRAICSHPDGVKASFLRLTIADQLLKSFPPKWTEKHE